MIFLYGLLLLYYLYKFQQ